jgi:hypothetical protein
MKRKVVVQESFKTLEMFIDTMEKRPLNKAFKGRTIDRLASQRDETEKNGRFSGVNTYSEGMEILKKGYKDPLDKMKKSILKIGQNDNYKRPRIQNDFIGFAPNVPNALMNLPITMINKEKQTAKAKTIHLVYSFCASASTKKDDFIKGGINFISLVNSLEKQGFRVKIDIIFTSIVTNTTSSFLVTLKEYGQQINLLKLAFPLVHPAMLRRLAFKWLETTPELKDSSYTNGYGLPLNLLVGDNLEKERNFLKDYEILKGTNVYYCNVYTALRANDVNELASRMEIIK